MYIHTRGQTLVNCAWDVVSFQQIATPIEIYIKLQNGRSHFSTGKVANILQRAFSNFGDKNKTKMFVPHNLGNTFLRADFSI